MEKTMYPVKVSLKNEGELETFSHEETKENSLLAGLLLRVVK